MAHLRKTKKSYEEYLNDLYRGHDLTEEQEFEYLKSRRLLMRGRLGSAVRRGDPIAFEVGFHEWQGG